MFKCPNFKWIKPPHLSWAAQEEDKVVVNVFSSASKLLPSSLRLLESGYNLLESPPSSSVPLLTTSDLWSQRHFCARILHWSYFLPNLWFFHVPKEVAGRDFYQLCPSFQWSSGNWSSWERCFCRALQFQVFRMSQLAAVALIYKEALLQSVF